MANKPRFIVKPCNSNFAVIDAKTLQKCPKLYQNTPAGDCIYPADDFASEKSAQLFANKMNKKVAKKRYKEAIKAYPDADDQILIAAQHT